MFEYPDAVFLSDVRRELAKRLGQKLIDGDALVSPAGANAAASRAARALGQQLVASPQRLFLFDDNGLHLRCDDDDNDSAARSGAGADAGRRRDVGDEDDGEDAATTRRGYSRTLAGLRLSPREPLHAIAVAPAAPAQLRDEDAARVARRAGAFTLLGGGHSSFSALRFHDALFDAPWSPDADARRDPKLAQQAREERAANMSAADAAAEMERARVRVRGFGVLAAVLYVAKARASPAQRDRLVARLWAHSHDAPLTRVVHEVLHFNRNLGVADHAAVALGVARVLGWLDGTPKRGTAGGHAAADRIALLLEVRRSCCGVPDCLFLYFFDCWPSSQLFLAKPTATFSSTRAPFPRARRGAALCVIAAARAWRGGRVSVRGGFAPR